MAGFSSFSLSGEKGIESCAVLKRQDIQRIDWAMNAEEAKDDPEDREKLMKSLREKGLDILNFFCSSQNWKIDGAIGDIF